MLVCGSALVMQLLGVRTEMNSNSGPEGTRFLLDAGSVHLEEGGVQEQVQDVLLPGPLRVGVTAQGAQQLCAGPEAGGVVGAG